MPGLTLHPEDNYGITGHPRNYEELQDTHGITGHPWNYGTPRKLRITGHPRNYGTPMKLLFPFFLTYFNMVRWPACLAGRTVTVERHLN